MNEPSLLPRVLTLHAEDLEDLRRAHRRLEYPGFAARLTQRLGAPIEKLFKVMPASWHESLHRGINASLERTLQAAIVSLGQEGESPRSRRYHQALGMLSGAASGLFGLPAVLAELPVTSGIILRSIADIARGQGEDLRDPAARMACMEVFALGGRSGEATETGYYGIRLVLGLHFSRISERVASAGIVRMNPPAVVRLVAEIAARFGVVVTEKTALQMVPLLGAGTGSLVNLVFVEYFQDLAEAHFTLRRLERRYGAEYLRREYEKLSATGGGEE